MHVRRGVRMPEVQAQISQELLACRIMHSHPEGGMPPTYACSSGMLTPLLTCTCPQGPLYMVGHAPGRWDHP